MKNTKKRFLIPKVLILLFTLMIAMAIGVSAEENEIKIEGDFQYKENEDGITASIIGFCGVNEKAEIPELVGNGLTVTTIAEGTFAGLASWYFSDNIVELTIPKTVTTIGNVLGTCKNLKKYNVDSENEKFCDIDGVLFSKDKTVLLKCPQAIIGKYIVPDGTKIISEYSFYSCEKLTEIALPDSLESVGESAFGWCTGLKTIAFPNATVINNDPFGGMCVNLESIALPKTLKKISNWFYNTKLRSITIPNSIEQIDDGVFSGTTLLSNIKYLGTESQWKNIIIGKNNDYILNAHINFEISSTEKNEIFDVNISFKSNAAEIKYLDGRGDKFEPDANATRYEVVKALYNVFEMESSASPKVLTDVSDEYKEIVNAFTSCGIIDGYEDGTFLGEKAITRAEVAKIISVMMNLDIENAKDAGFTDVSGWAVNYVNACANAKYVNGMGDGTFAPNANITRAQLATIINNITGAKAGTECKYSDVNTDAWYFGYVAAAAKDPKTEETTVVVG